VILNELEPDVALIPLSFETHAKTRIRPLASYAFAAKETLIPLTAADCVALCHEIPVVFVPSDGGYALAAMAGVASGRNILIDETGRWHGSHVPAAWRRGPFRLAAIAGEEERLALCLDDSSDQIGETEGQPLFDETGAATQLLNDASSILSKYEADRRHTVAICAQVQSLGLLAPWDLDIAQPDGSKTQLKGLFRVDEPKIASLSGDDLVALRNTGGLGMIYAHLLSLSKISLLARISQQVTLRDQQREAVRSNKVDLDRAFGIVEDDPFIF
jgi:hypothetical protein